MVPEPSKSTGVTFPYEKQAMNGDDMPDGLPYYDQLMFQLLRLLYDNFKKGIIDRETAQKKKKQMLSEYECYKIQWQMIDEVSCIVRRTELARADFRKNPTVENGWNLLNACEGRKTA